MSNDLKYATCTNAGCIVRWAWGMLCCNSTVSVYCIMWTVSVKHTVNGVSYELYCKQSPCMYLSLAILPAVVFISLDLLHRYFCLINRNCSIYWLDYIQLQNIILSPWYKQTRGCPWYKQTRGFLLVCFIASIYNK